MPNPNLNAFKAIFKNAHDAGGRVVRWWFHTNGTVTPGYNSDGTVKAIQQSHIDGVKAILAAANAAGVAVNISLWSFDMAQDNAAGAAANNKNLLTQDNIRQSYVDNYLTPLEGTPGLYSYEIFKAIDASPGASMLPSAVRFSCTLSRNRGSLRRHEARPRIWSIAIQNRSGYTRSSNSRVHAGTVTFALAQTVSFTT